MEVVLSRDFTAEEAGLRKDGGEILQDEGRQGLPVRGGRLEEALLGLVGDGALVDREDAAIVGLLGLVELAERLRLGERGVLVERILAWMAR